MKKYNIFNAVFNFRAAENQKQPLDRCGIELGGLDCAVIDSSVMHKICEKDITVEAHVIECKVVEDVTILPQRPLAYYSYDEDSVVRLEKPIKGCLVVYDRLVADYADITKSAVSMAVCSIARSAKKDIVISDDVYPNGILWSQQIFKSYNEKYSENILNKLALLFIESKGSVRFRGRYFKLLNELTYQNFVTPLSKVVAEKAQKLYATIIEHNGVSGDLPNNMNLAGYGCFEKIFVDTSKGELSYLTLKRYTALSKFFSFRSAALVSSNLIAKNNLDEIKRVVDSLYAGGIDLILLDNKANKDELYVSKANYIKNYCDLVAATCAQISVKKKKLIIYPAASRFVFDGDGYDLAFSQRIKKLSQNGIAYDICDELTFKSFTQFKGGSIIVGSQEYDGVVLIDSENVSFTTANKIQELLRQKVNVWSCGEKLRLIDGVKSARIDGLVKQFDCVRRIEDISDERLLKLGAFEVCRFGVLPDMSRVVFLARNDSTKITFKKRGRISTIDVLSGSETEIIAEKGLGKLFGKKTVKTANILGSSLFVRAGRNRRSLYTTTGGIAIQTGEIFDIKPNQRNFLALNKCSYRTTRGTWNDEEVMPKIADALITAKSGAEFKFVVNSEEFSGRCSVIVPKFTDVSVSVNRSKAQQIENAFDISGLFKDGSNEIVVSVSNIASQINSVGMPECILLVGEFVARADGDITYGTDRKIYTDGKFTLVSMPEQLDANKIRESGFWFFSGALEISCNVFVNKRGSGVYKLKFSDMNAELVEVSVNGITVGSIGFYPYEISIGDYLYDGDNQITLKLYSHDAISNIKMTEAGMYAFEPLGVGLSRTNQEFIELEGVTKAYKVGEKTIMANNNVNLNIAHGEFVAITGPSGSGKSTLLNILGGMDVSDSGSVVIDGVNIANFDERELINYHRNDIGFVFQQCNLIDDMTVRENIELASKLSSSAIIPDIALGAMGLSDYVDCFVDELSAGQQQRVAVARALTKNPLLLLCDEPTGVLDAKESKEILSMLYETCKTTGKTAIVVTNNEDVCQMADRVIRLEKGCVIENSVNSEL